MKTPGRTRALVFGIGMALMVIRYAQAVPAMMSYQGRLIANGTNFNGIGYFKFALVNMDGTVTNWRNHVSSSTPVQVSNGLFSVMLGDSYLPFMQPLAPSTFQDRSAAQLRIWFCETADGAFLQLAPDQPLGSVGYAMMAAQVEPGAIGTSELADNGVTGSKIAAAAITGYHIENGSIHLAGLARDGALTGQVIRWNGAAWAASDEAVARTVDSVFGRTGAVVAASGDYTAAQVGAVGSNDVRYLAALTNAAAFATAAQGAKADTAVQAESDPLWAANSNAFVRTNHNGNVSILGPVAIGTNPVPISGPYGKNARAGLRIVDGGIIIDRKAGNVWTQEMPTASTPAGIYLGYDAREWCRASLWLSSATHTDGTNTYDAPVDIYFGRGTNFNDSSITWSMSARGTNQGWGHDQNNNFQIYEMYASGTSDIGGPRVDIYPDLNGRGGPIKVGTETRVPAPYPDTNATLIVGDWTKSPVVILEGNTNAGAASYPRIRFYGGTNIADVVWSNGVLYVSSPIAAPSFILGTNAAVSNWPVADGGLATRVIVHADTAAMADGTRNDAARGMNRRDRDKSNDPTARNSRTMGGTSRDTSIDGPEASGTVLAAIAVLNRKMAALEAENKDLKARLGRVEGRLEP